MEVVRAAAHEGVEVKKLKFEVGVKFLQKAQFQLWGINENMPSGEDGEDGEDTLSAQG